MTDYEIENKMRMIINKFSENFVHIKLNDLLTDFGFDSTDILTMVIQMEKTFHIKCDEDDFSLRCFDSLNKFIEYIKMKLNIE